MDGMASLGEVRLTQRGFEFVRWLDVYGKRCSLQESKTADEPSIWLGCADNQFDNRGDPLSPRMHLSRDQVEALVNHLVTWLETGRLGIGE